MPSDGNPPLEVKTWLWLVICDASRFLKVVLAGCISAFGNWQFQFM
jgi:hypothetical protein